MGDKNHLHVCRHCGNVVATSTTTAPEECFNCGEGDFSRYLTIPELAGD